MERRGVERERERNRNGGEQVRKSGRGMPLRLDETFRANFSQSHSHSLQFITAEEEWTGE